MNKSLKMDIGKMEYHGPFGGSKSYHGYRIDTLKSALQKYIRRAETNKSIKCALELDYFYNIPKARGIRTNMINRLRIIQPDPVPISNIETFLSLYIFVKLSTNNSVSGLGIKVSLLTKNFLLQNSFSFNM